MGARVPKSKIFCLFFKNMLEFNLKWAKIVVNSRKTDTFVTRSPKIGRNTLYAVNFGKVDPGSRSPRSPLWTRVPDLGSGWPHLSTFILSVFSRNDAILISLRKLMITCCLSELWINFKLIYAIIVAFEYSMMLQAHGSSERVSSPVPFCSRFASIFFIWDVLP